MRRPNRFGLAPSDPGAVGKAIRCVAESCSPTKPGIVIMHTSRGGLAPCDSKQPPSSVKTRVFFRQVQIEVPRFRGALPHKDFRQHHRSEKTSKVCARPHDEAFFSLPSGVRRCQPRLLTGRPFATPGPRGPSPFRVFSIPSSEDRRATRLPRDLPVRSRALGRNGVPDIGLLTLTEFVAEAHLQPRPRGSPSSATRTPASARH